MPLHKTLRFECLCIILMNVSLISSFKLAISPLQFHTACRIPKYTMEGTMNHDQVCSFIKGSYSTCLIFTCFGMQSLAVPKGHHLLRDTCVILCIIRLFVVVAFDIKFIIAYSKLIFVMVGLNLRGWRYD